MNHLKVHLKIRILVLEGVVAMRGRNKNFFYPMIDKGFDIFPGQAFEYILIAGVNDDLAETKPLAALARFVVERAS